MKEIIFTNLEPLFNKADTNRDGFIDPIELGVKLDEGFDPFPPGLIDGIETWDNEKKIAEFFKLADKNGDGLVSKEDFK